MKKVASVDLPLPIKIFSIQHEVIIMINLTLVSITRFNLGKRMKLTTRNWNRSYSPDTISEKIFEIFKSRAIIKHDICSYMLHAP